MLSSQRPSLQSDSHWRGLFGGCWSGGAPLLSPSAQNGWPLACRGCPGCGGLLTTAIQPDNIVPSTDRRWSWIFKLQQFIDSLHLPKSCYLQLLHSPRQQRQRIIFKSSSAYFHTPGAGCWPGGASWSSATTTSGSTAAFNAYFLRLSVIESDHPLQGRFPVPFTQAALLAHSILVSLVCREAGPYRVLRCFIRFVQRGSHGSCKGDEFSQFSSQR